MEISSQTALTIFPSRRTLVIMAKAPRPGRVKTRLNQSLPSDAVTALYRCLLEDTVRLAKSLGEVELAVMCPLSDREELVSVLGEAVQVVAQRGEGLAAGLTSVFRHFTAGGQQPVIAFNSDSPHIAPSVLDRAFKVLASHDVVVGPTQDGGYYLVGAKAWHPSLFESDGLGTKSALERLLTQTTALELSTAFTECCYDIDVPEDLLQLARELHISPGKAPSTAGWFSEWQREVAQLQHTRQRAQQSG